MKDHVKVQLAYQLSAAAEASPGETSGTTLQPTHRIVTISGHYVLARFIMQQR